MIIKLQCEICKHDLCTVDTEKLNLPLRGSMFGPPKSWMPNPFHPEVDWMWMRCPMCRKRPFIEEGNFTTVNGNWLRVRKDGTVDTPILDKGSFQVPLENTEKYAEAWGTFIDSPRPKKHVEHECGETGLALMEEPVEKQEKLKKKPTVLEEVMRLHELGMKPGQISRELEKGGVKLNHLQIGKKIKEEIKKREDAA